jgi:hypothetical protein
MAIGRSLRHRLRAEDVAAAALVLDHHLLAPGLRQPLADRARYHVADTTGRRGHHDHDLPGGIGLRCCRRRGQQAENFVMVGLRLGGNVERVFYHSMGWNNDGAKREPGPIPTHVCAELAPALASPG